MKFLFVKSHLIRLLLLIVLTGYTIHCTNYQKDIQRNSPDPVEENLVYDTVEKFFTAMKEKKYAVIWEGLSTNSRSEIVKSVISFAAKDKIYLKEKETATDFASGGPLAKSYWDGFLNVFNPEMVLKQSTWKLKMIKKDYAELDILYHKAEHPANLKLFKEEGKWRIGLEETFGYIRRYIMRK